MATFLRVVQKNRWHPETGWNGWQTGDIQGDALLDLQTKGNALSVYDVEGGLDAERIVVALAAGRQFLSTLDYVVFDDAPLASSSIDVVQTSGDTPDSVVNLVHYDLKNLTVGKVVRLARIVSGNDRKRITKAQMKGKLKKALDNQWLDSSMISGDLLGQVYKDQVQ